MPDIYEQHDKAFRNVSAYVVMKGPNLVAKVAFKFPRDGAGRLYCYLHFPGTPMVRGYASGYGYDKRSAAVASAASKIADPERRLLEHAQTAIQAVENDNGEYWDSRLRKAGFEVIQSI
jgi:hypothetical protein